MATPSTPVEILGLNDVPNAGEVFVATDSDKEARTYAETFIAEGKKKLLDDTKSKLSLDDLFSQIKAGNVKELNLIIKADVQGSVEAVKQSLIKLSNEEVVDVYKRQRRRKASHIPFIWESGILRMRTHGCSWYAISRICARRRWKLFLPVGRLVLPGWRLCAVETEKAIPMSLGGATGRNCWHYPVTGAVAES